MVATILPVCHLQSIFLSLSLSATACSEINTIVQALFFHIITTFKKLQEAEDSYFSFVKSLSLNWLYLVSVLTWTKL